MSYGKEEHSTYDVRVLNGLIVSMLDNVDEYRRAIFMTEQRLNRLQRVISARLRAVERMQRHVRSLGGVPATERSQLAAAFAALLNNRVLPTGDDDNLLHDAQRGEVALHRQFEACLANCMVSEEARQAASAAFDSLTHEPEPQQSWSAPISVVATNLESVAVAN